MLYLSENVLRNYCKVEIAEIQEHFPLRKCIFKRAFLRKLSQRAKDHGSELILQ